MSIECEQGEMDEMRSCVVLFMSSGLQDGFLRFLMMRQVDDQRIWDGERNFRTQLQVTKLVKICEIRECLSDCEFRHDLSCAHVTREEFFCNLQHLHHHMA